MINPAKHKPLLAQVMDVVTFCCPGVLKEVDMSPNIYFEARKTGMFRAKKKKKSKTRCKLETTN